MHQPLLAFEILEDHHTGYNLASIVFDVLIQYDLCDKLLCITSDNAANNGTMAEHLQTKLEQVGVDWDPERQHIRCLAHIIHLVVQAFLDKLELDNNSFLATLEKIRGIAKSIRGSTLRWESFQECCKSYGIAPATIPLDMPVRWNSTYRMVEQTVYLKRPIRRYLDDHDDKLGKFHLTDDEWEQAEILLVFLMPFKRCTKRFECNLNNPEIDYVFFAYDTMYNHIDDVKDALVGDTGIGLLSCAPYMHAAIEEMEKTLKLYYEKTKFPTIYGDATILNPRVKLSLFEEETWDDTDTNHYTNGCRQRFLDEYINESLNTTLINTTTPSTLGNRSAQVAFHDDAEYQKLLTQRSSKRRRNDFDRYIDIPNDANIPSSLKWWRDNYKLFPELAKMARDVLAVPASGCAVEREFSISGRIATWQRNRLNGSTIADAMFYKGALKRQGVALRNSKVDDNQDLPVSERIGEVPQEWQDKWWMEKTKHVVGPEILAMFSQN